jgi:hypothetical protein
VQRDRGPEPSPPPAPARAPHGGRRRRAGVALASRSGTSAAISTSSSGSHRQHRLGDLRRASSRALHKAFTSGAGISVADRQFDAFLFEPGSDRYLGRLCKFNTCPKGKWDCLVPGCGAVPFNEILPDFAPTADLLASVESAMLFRRGVGRIRSALELPGVTEDGRGRRRR